LRSQGVTDFRAYFTNHPQAVSECGAMIKIVNINKTAVKLLHAKSKQEVLDNLNIVFGGNNFDNFSTELISIAEGKTNFEWEGVNFTLDGKPLILNLQWSAAPTYEQSLAKVFVSTMDVTERRQAETQLREQERQVSTLMSNLPGMVYRCLNDKDWTMEFVSEGCLALTGYTKEEFIKTRVVYNDLIFKEDQNMVFNKIHESLDRNETFQLNYRIHTKTGQMKWVWEQGRKIVSLDKQWVLEGFITDITERKLAEQSANLISEVQQKIIQLEDPKGIEQVVGQKISELIGDIALAGVIFFDPTEKAIKIVGLYGLNNIYYKLSRQFNLDLTSIPFYINDFSGADLELFRSGKFIKYEGGLFELFSGKISKTLCKIIEKQLDLQDIYLMGFVRHGIHFGGLVILAKTDITPYIETIKTIANQATILINRIYSEKELRESEESFRRIFEECPVGIALSNPQAQIINVNPMFTAVLGYSQKEIAGRSFKDFTYSEDIAENENLLNQLIKLKIPFFTMQKRYIHKNGNVIWANITVTAIRGQNGELVSTLAMIEDVTEKKRTEDAFQYEQYLMQTLMDNIPDSVYFKDLESRFIRVNQATVSKFKAQSVNEVLGKTDADFFPAEIAQTELEEERRIIQTEEPIISNENIEIWKDERSPSWSSDTKMPLHDKTGQIMGTFGISRDITDRKSKEEEIKRLNADLEKRVESRTKELHLRNEELEAFTYSISHDLKAPLRGIIGYSQLLLQDHASQLDEEGKSFLNKLAQSSEQLNQLIDDLLNYSHLDRRPTSHVNFTISEIINAVVDERLSIITEKGITLHKEIEEETINSSPELVMQIMRSYLDNAIKYTSKKQSPEIWLTYKNEGDTSLFTVKDNGIGFDPKYSEKIFEVFYRLQRQDQFPGTGIGLALVKKAAEILKYRVWAKSEVDVGSTFFLELKRIQK
jgi:PAS domain S-box-containing protein